MSKSKHTPGPWAIRGEWITRADEEGEGGKNEYGYQSGHYIAKVCEPIGGRAVLRANARLIAAAPETLAAAKRAVAQFQSLGKIEGHESMISLQCAIEEAEGGAE